MNQSTNKSISGKTISNELHHSKPSNIHIIQTPKRTEGDGMETTNISVSNITTDNPIILESSTSSNLIHSISANTNTTGKMVHLIPKISNSLLVHVSKEPKYVPYEPYKAAVYPRGMFSIKQKKNVKKKDSKNVIGLHQNSKLVLKNNEKAILCPQTLPHLTPEPGCDTVMKAAIENQMKLLSVSDDPESDTEIKRLKIENLELENQIKYQAQVNGELKKLLVAAVGEDIETRVNHLTEDKLHLAKALLNSAQKLNTHQEQMEWLAGQCEVWRSKFLASSLMVEELAKWKAVLTQKVCDYQEVTKKILAEHQSTHESISKTYINLAILGNNFDLSVMTNTETKIKPKSSNVVDLASHCEALSSSLKEQLLGSSPFPINTNVPELAQDDVFTNAEKQAYQCLNECLTLAFSKTDVACSAVMGAAGAVSGITNSLSLYHPPCCAHCSDQKVQTI